MICNIGLQTLTTELPVPFNCRFFFAFSRKHRELELAPTVKSPQYDLQTLTTELPVPFNWRFFSRFREGVASWSSLLQ